MSHFQLKQQEGKGRTLSPESSYSHFIQILSSEVINPLCVCFRQCCVVWSMVRMERRSVCVWLSVKNIIPPSMKSA